jgi:hypothetical protein
VTDPTGNDFPDQAADRGDWLGESVAAEAESQLRRQAEQRGGDPLDPFGETIAAELAARLVRRREPLDPFGEQVVAELASRLLQTPDDQLPSTPARPRWEYRIEDWRAGGTSSHRTELSKVLADAGADGWELVGMEQLTWGVVLVFKRLEREP